MSRSAFVLIAGVCLAAGCTSVAADTEELPGTLCQQAVAWTSTPPPGTGQIAPTETSEEGGRIYRFDLDGRGSLRSLQAACGWGVYAECAFSATRTDGQEFTFSELSTFGLWNRNGELYLLYRIVDPKTEDDAAKRRLVRIEDPPVEVCNQIGDYSDLM